MLKVFFHHGNDTATIGPHGIQPDDSSELSIAVVLTGFLL